MKMTRKDFELIASNLNESRPTPTDVEKYLQWSLVVEGFITNLRRTNPRFDPDRFRTACHK